MEPDRVTYVAYLIDTELNHERPLRVTFYADGTIHLNVVVKGHKSLLLFLERGDLMNLSNFFAGVASECEGIE